MSIEALLSTQVIDTTSIGRTVMTAADAAAVRTAIDAQQVLVSGTSIKTVNGTSLLGSGDVTVSASPGGSSGQLQYNNAGAFGGATAVVYAGSGTHLTVTAQTATDVPAVIKGAASQTGNLTEWKNSAGTKLSYMSSAGYFVGTVMPVLTSYVWGWGYHGGGPSVYGGAYASGNSMYISVKGAAGKHLYFVNQAGSNAFDFDMDAGALNLTAQTATDVPLVVKLAASHSGNVIEVNSNAGSGGDQILVTPTRVELKSKILQVYNTTGAGGTAKIELGDKDGSIYGTVEHNRSTGRTSICQSWAGGAIDLKTGLTTTRLTVDADATAGNTSLMLWDVDAGTLVRVSVGAADSGGTGYKLLRVPN